MTQENKIYTQGMQLKDALKSKGLLPPSPKFCWRLISDIKWNSVECVALPTMSAINVQ